MINTPKIHLKLFGLVAGLAIACVSGSLAAEESTSAMAAPKCDLEKIQKLCEASDDCVKVEKGAWEGGYNVTSKDKDAENRFLAEVLVKNCM